MKQAVYGIDSFMMQPAAQSGYPTSWADAHKMSAIVKDSFGFNDSEASENDIEVEDMSDFYASLPSSVATKGFTVQTYDLSEENYKYLCGFVSDTEGTDGWLTENPNFQLPNQAVRVITKEFADFPSKTFEWANLTCKVTRAGNIGKSGFPNFNLTFKQQAVFDAEGKPMGGHRWKFTKKA